MTAYIIFGVFGLLLTITELLMMWQYFVKTTAANSLTIRTRLDQYQKLHPDINFYDFNWKTKKGSNKLGDLALKHGTSYIFIDQFVELYNTTLRKPLVEKKYDNVWISEASINLILNANGFKLGSNLTSIKNKTTKQVFPLNLEHHYKPINASTFEYNLKQVMELVVPTNKIDN